MRQQTTFGWKFLVNCKYGLQEWVPLKLLKESNPLEVAEFVTARNITDDNTFAWWVPFVLRKRDRNISAVISRVRKAAHA